MEGDGYRHIVEEANNEERPVNPMPVRDLLERGGPWEVMPDRLRGIEERARRYVARDDLFPPAARDRVREVWLEGKYRSAYLETHEIAKGET